MINSIVLMGRLVKDPEIKSSGNGVEYCRFTVAVDRRYKKDEEKQTDFIDCVAWRQTAVFINKYFKKGSMIAVEGCIRTGNYTDKDGNKRKSVDVMVENVSFCGGKNESGQASSGSSLDIKPDEEEPFKDIIDDDDDLPF